VLPTRNLEPVSRTYVSQGLKLRYADWGNPGAPLLLLVHGICDHARSWDHTARALCQEWHVVAPDLRGHGDSAWSPDRSYLSSRYLLDIANLIALLPHDRMSIVAHSLGGNIMARFSAVYPERVTQLVLIEGLGPSPQALAEWERQGPVRRTRAWLDTLRGAAAKAPRILESLDAAESRLMRANPHLPAEHARELARYAVRPQAGGYVWKHDPLVSAFAPEDFALENPPFWKAIVSPTMLFQGAKSWMTNPETDGRAANLRNCRTVVIENAGHWPHHDQFDAFITSLRPFLDLCLVR
jgi:pimeloyl-ACP methyl ester carboxylesterase